MCSRPVEVPTPEWQFKALNMDSIFPCERKASRPLAPQGSAAKLQHITVRLADARGVAFAHVQPCCWSRPQIRETVQHCSGGEALLCMESTGSSSRHCLGMLLGHRQVQRRPPTGTWHRVSVLFTPCFSCVPDWLRPRQAPMSFLSRSRHP